MALATMEAFRFAYAAGGGLLKGWKTWPFGDQIDCEDRHLLDSIRHTITTVTSNYFGIFVLNGINKCLRKFKQLQIEVWEI